MCSSQLFTKYQSGNCNSSWSKCETKAKYVLLISSFYYFFVRMSKFSIPLEHTQITYQLLFWHQFVFPGKYLPYYHALGTYPSALGTFFCTTSSFILRDITLHKEFLQEEHLLSQGLCYQLQLPKCNTSARWLEQTATGHTVFLNGGNVLPTHTHIWQLIRF